jgi:hypothetical protein
MKKKDLKKCYEGMIYEILTKKNKTEYVGVVEGDFSNGILSHFGYYVNGLIPFWKLKSLISENGIEIIGNIFETPELLK